jgi:hypothetical protein
MSVANVTPRNGGRGQTACHVPGTDWLTAYVEAANHGGIERVRV